MARLSHEDILTFLVQLSVLLIAARLLGEFFRKLKQPAIIGEILAGVALGPSLMGQLWPEAFHDLFYAHPNAYLGFDALTQVGVIFLLFIAGMEIDMSIILKQGRQAATISLLGLILPFIIAFGAAWWGYEWMVEGESDRLIFVLFFATALSITALPVIAKILLDMNLIRSRVGSMILVSALINDLLGWMLFSVILSMMNSAGGTKLTDVLSVIGLTLLFSLLLLTLGRFLINRLLFLPARFLSKPGGEITIAIALCFLGALFTEYIGIHAIFGAFLMGIAFGDSVNFSHKGKEILEYFITSIFAPIFFVSIGLKVNFVDNFDLMLTVLVLLIAIVAKVVGAGAGARLGGYPLREALAIGCGMNARGAMEIILGLLALEAGIIQENMFVALVIMAIVTSIMAGPCIRWALGRPK